MGSILLDIAELSAEIYKFTGPALSLAYIPQIYRVWIDRTGAYTISIVTWLMWTLSLTITTCYSYFVVADPLFFISSLCSCLGCFMVSLIAIYKRITYLKNKS